LLGDTALRVSSRRDIPVVFTHHTQYEQYTHYVPGDSDLMKRFVIDLAVGFCNLCDAVIAPSDTIKQRLLGLDVMTDIHEIPTGVDTALFNSGDGHTLRRRLEIDPTDFVVGHVGRLAPEKGLEFLAPTVARFVKSKPNALFLVAGHGSSSNTVKQAFADAGISNRLIMLGMLQRNELADVYNAMDVFAFASQSETQGMVLSEAMAASTPVVAVDASGVREVLVEGVNGLMLPKENADAFVDALGSIYLMTAEERENLVEGALQTADEFSMPSTAASALQLYRTLIHRGRKGVHGDDMWSTARRRFDEEWKIWSNVANAVTHAIGRTSNKETVQ
jgi:glycosyltransferase involved in cell wall biosynthesis